MVVVTICRNWERPERRKGAPKNFQEDGLGEFHSALAEIAELAAQENVVTLAYPQGGDVELDGLGLAAHVAIMQIGQLVVEALRVLRHLLRPVAIKRRHIVEHAGERRLAELLFLGQIAAHEKGLSLGVEKYVQRPAALMAQNIGGGLIELIQVRALHPVGDHRDEIVIDQLGGFGVRKAFPVHHMAPMAGGIADGEENRLAGLFGLRQHGIAPIAPLHRIVLVYQEIGAGGGGECVHHWFHWRRR